MFAFPANSTSFSPNAFQPQSDACHETVNQTFSCVWCVSPVCDFRSWLGGKYRTADSDPRWRWHSKDPRGMGWGGVVVQRAKGRAKGQRYFLFVNASLGLKTCCCYRHHTPPHSFASPPPFPESQSRLISYVKRASFFVCFLYFILYLLIDSRLKKKESWIVW